MSRLTPLRWTLLAGWLILGALLVFMIVTAASGWPVTAGVLLVIASFGATGYLIATARPGRARQEQAFLATYGSLDGARAALDLEALRGVRERDGLIPAVRLVRQQHPDIPLAQAAEIVKSL